MMTKMTMVQESRELSVEGFRRFERGRKTRRREWDLLIRVYFVPLEKSSKDFMKLLGKSQTAQAGSLLLVSCASHPTFLFAFTF